MGNQHKVFTNTLDRNFNCPPQKPHPIQTGIEHMHIIIDSNIIHNNWFLRSAPLRLLIHYINNEGCTLVIPRVVTQEVDNLYMRSLNDAIRDVENSNKALEKVVPSIKLEAPRLEQQKPYSLESVLKAKIEDLKIVEYKNISHEEMARRAILRVRPFRENEKGYRDTLIWLSLLDHLENNKITEDVFFITSNTNDFMGKTKDHFHDDLQNDIDKKNLQCKIYLISSLNEFLKNHVNSDEHALDRHRDEEEFRAYLEESAISYLQSMDSSVRSGLSKELFSHTGILSSCSPLSAHIMEGLEDFFYIETKALENHEVYVSCKFELRITELILDITTREFENHRELITACDGFFEEEHSHEISTISLYIRPGFLASFTYNQLTKECSGFSVDQFALVRRGRPLSTMFEPNIQ
ncbi:PIN domain-containing protein [Pseudomonas sp. NPDC090755]|uniref:PIN domain-containing protein n=1 Tax=Pseudomonas sp. NPDC090755 TaxID=3364481 RepID=UPI00383BDDDE